MVIFMSLVVTNGQLFTARHSTCTSRSYKTAHNQI